MGQVYDFIANTSEGVIGVDCEQTIVLWNEAATFILEHQPAEVLGRKCYLILLGQDSQCRAVCRPGCDVIETAKRLELPPTQELASRTKRGDTIWLTVSTVIVPSQSRELSVLVHLIREVSEQHDLTRVVREFADVVSSLARREDVRRARRDSKSQACAGLTLREREVLEHLMLGVTTDEIANRLCISPRTVRNHVGNILNKLGVHSRLEAVTYSLRNGLV